MHNLFGCFCDVHDCTRIHCHRTAQHKLARAHIYRCMNVYILFIFIFTHTRPSLPLPPCSMHIVQPTNLPPISSAHVLRMVTSPSSRCYSEGAQHSTHKITRGRPLSTSASRMVSPISEIISCQRAQTTQCRTLLGSPATRALEIRSPPWFFAPCSYRPLGVRACGLLGPGAPMFMKVLVQDLDYDQPAVGLLSICVTLITGISNLKAAALSASM